MNYGERALELVVQAVVTVTVVVASLLFFLVEVLSSPAWVGLASICTVVTGGFWCITHRTEIAMALIELLQRIQ